jgi:DNA-binding NtrC family response regulator
VQVLLVDSDRRALSMMDRAMRPLRGARISQVTSLKNANRCLENQVYDLIVCSYELRDGDSLSLFEAARAQDMAIIVASGFFDEATSMKLLAYPRARILEKPIEMSDLTSMAEGLLGVARPDDFVDERTELLNSVREVPAQAPPQPLHNRPWEHDAIIGEAPSWRQVLELVHQVADTRAEVLLLGESGTGKELVAKAVHTVSPRSQHAFVAVNCAAIPANLLESELFGHVKGAFTSAVKDRDGRFKKAHRGTIFLDEIGEMPLDLQAKLLRVLQEKRFTPVGSDKEEQADFRVVAATNVQLRQMVHDGRFREDLYHRLYVFPIHLPPLRERREDIEALALHFLQAANTEYRRAVTGFSSAVLRALQAHDWPGNVRQLENTIYRLVIVTAEGLVQPHHIPADLGLELPPHEPVAQAPVVEPAQAIGGAARPSLPAEGLELKRVLAEIEADYIDQALERTSGNRNQAARLLGLNRTTLVEKLRKRSES